MISRIRRLPSPALIVASIALVFAVAGGIGYAATKISGSNIKKNSIPGNRIKKHSLRGNRLKKNTVTGKRIKESTLHKVPKAAHADTADFATNANHASSADNATNAGHASSADNATNAGHANTADTANSAFSTFHDGGIVMPDSLAGSPIGTLSVPQAGSYVINAKLEAFNASGTVNLTSGECTLSAEGDVDTMFFDATASGTDDQEAVPLQLVHTFTTPGTVVLRCTDFGTGSGFAFFTKITASQVAHLTNTGF